MIGRRGFAVAGVLCLMAGTGGCNSETFGTMYPPYRYRLTVEVETPQGVRSGSSVIEVQWNVGGTIWSTQRSAGFRVKGEAVAVDLPDGQTLFALLRSTGSVDWPAYAMRGHMKDIKTAKGADRARHPVPRSVDVGSDIIDNYPMLVRFRDIADPKSVEKVDPDALDKSFGKGVKLRQITVQLTDDPVTRGIGKRLTSIGVLRNRSLDNEFEMTTNPTLAQELGSNDFYKGTDQ